MKAADAPKNAMIAGRLLRAGVALALIAAVAFVALAPPERCPSVSSAELRDAAQGSVNWLVRNQEGDGSWLYSYDAEEDSSTAGYNATRHAGVTMGLYQAAAAGLPGALESADRGLEWARERLLRRDGWAALELYGEVETGPAALLAAGLAIRREDTGDRRYDDLLRRLGRFLVAQTEPSGAVLASYDLAAGVPEPGVRSKYFTGEAYWALARLHLAFPGEGWDEVADRIGAYLATSRDEAEDHWPPIPDHWAAYGAAETVRFPERRAAPLTEQETDYAHDQAGLFGAQSRWVSARFGPWGALVRGPNTPRGGGYGVISEALTGWWLVARAEPALADLRRPLADRATCVAGLAIEAQVDQGEAASAARPGRVLGAWFIDGETRMDDQQHALAGLLRTIPIVEANAGPGPSGPSGDDAAPPLLWAAVLLLLLNPARGSIGVPRAGRTAPEAAWLAAAGGALGGLAVWAAAALGGPLLEALDVSDSSFRVAAGIVAGVAGAIDLIRRPPSPVPALPGRRAAFVPVAIPLVARPALLVVALGAGADAGAPVAAAASAAGVALLVALVAAVPLGGAGRRGLRWAAALTAAALLAGGVVLTIDGITAV